MSFIFVALGGAVGAMGRLHADPAISGTIDGWLEQFEMFSIYEVLS